MIFPRSFPRFFPGLFLVSAGLVDIICQGTHGYCLLLSFHLCLFALHTKPSMMMIIGLGFFEDMYGNQSFGLTSFYLVFIMMILEKLKPIVDKLNNFWLIWLSFAGIVLVYVLLNMLTFYFVTGAFTLESTRLINAFLCTSVYPLMFMIVRNHTHYVRS